MLTASEVKPFLIHEDRPVRDAAIDYFKLHFPKTTNRFDLGRNHHSA